MILSLCVDDHLGLRFNHRRQSRDSAVVADLLAKAQKLWVHPQSAKLFPDSVTADENFLAKAGDGEWCFAEDDAYLAYAARIEKIILYRWNRVYPNDMTFVFPGQWRLVRSTDFPGSSHDNITCEEYEK